MDGFLAVSHDLQSILRLRHFERAFHEENIVQIIFHQQHSESVIFHSYALAIKTSGIYLNTGRNASRSALRRFLVIYFARVHCYNVVVRNDAALWNALSASRRLLLIAGPCVIESERLCLTIASTLKDICRKLDILF